jgi:hypothetical protein
LKLFVCYIRISISQLYKAHWDIKVFFKQIKQVLKINTFIGATPKAVLIQVWTSMISIFTFDFLLLSGRYRLIVDNSPLHFQMFWKGVSYNITELNSGRVYNV